MESILTILLGGVLLAAAFTELKNTNFFADDSRKKSNIF